jgi:hypothetical protein
VVAWLAPGPVDPMARLIGTPADGLGPRLLADSSGC